jgi:rhodanese-related sulfurtransferase
MLGFGKKNRNDVSVVEAYDLIVENRSNPKFIVLDVRTPQEFAESRLENALNLDYHSNNFEAEISKLSRDGKYLVYCRSGRRSSNAVKLMDNLGFKDVKNMQGGITKWTNKGLPVKF